ATAKDLADIKKILEEDQPVLFDGVPITDENRQRAMDILTGLLWEAKGLNKKTYGRKKKVDPKDKE
ncbi:transcriptional regulator, partial [Paenibacillus graminis]